MPVDLDKVREMLVAHVSPPDVVPTVQVKLELFAQLADECAGLRNERDECADCLDRERVRHDETRGYRQHAEQMLAEVREENARLREALERVRSESEDNLMAAIADEALEPKELVSSAALASAEREET